LEFTISVRISWCYKLLSVPNLGPLAGVMLAFRLAS
jgi:hypothetical protein